MRDQRFYENQQYLAAEGQTLCPWQRVVRSHQENLDYNAINAQPNYWFALDYLPDLTEQIMVTAPAHDSPLVEITVSSTLNNLNTGVVNTLGILAAAFGYLPTAANTEPSDINCLPISSGSTIPTVPDVPFIRGPEAFVAYDPTSLPVGGVNFPIWLRTVADPISTVVKLDRSGPGIFWYTVLVQINGNAIATAVADVTTRWEWAPV